MLFTSYNRILKEIGRIVATWADIELEILLHTSALAAQTADGWPTEYLAIPFQKLRKRWFNLTQTAFDRKVVNSVIAPLNMRLSECADERNDVVHSSWTRVDRKTFHARYWRQTDDLYLYDRVWTLRQLKEFTAKLESLLRDVRGFKG